jgi:hypothetical protein
MNQQMYGLENRQLRDMIGSMNWTTELTEIEEGAGLVPSLTRPSFSVASVVGSVAVLGSYPGRGPMSRSQPRRESRGTSGQANRSTSPPAIPSAIRAATRPDSRVASRRASRNDNRRRHLFASPCLIPSSIRDGNRSQNRHGGPSANPLQIHPANRSQNGSHGGSQGVDFSLFQMDGFANVP